MTTEQRLAICKEALRRIVSINLRCDECSASQTIYYVAKDALKKVEATTP